MKHISNEAPEKIYVEITHPFSEEYTQMIAFEDGDGIEYTRTDAFINKVADFINKRFYIGINSQVTSKENYNSLTELIRDFEQAMKG